MIGPLPTAQLKTDAFACKGGWDITTPPLTTPAGCVRDALNFMSSSEGGYQRILGYERFNGRASPSGALYYTLPAAIAGAWAVGNTITGASASATVLGVSSSGFVIAGVTGAFVALEALKISGVTVATCTGLSYVAGADTRATDAAFTARAADIARAPIAAVPGSGAVLGVWELKGVVYAFRNNAGGTAALMHKATAGGWSLVTTPALAPSGSYNFVNYNFGGATQTLAMYGASGTHKAFQFDGTTWTWVTTGMTTDTPTYIAAHRNHLFLTFGASVQHSPIGNPTGTWTPVFGAAEIAVGANVTGVVAAVGDQSTAALLITTRNKCFILYGTSSADWSLVSMAGESGALPRTVQKIGDILRLDDRGVSALTASANYGNFTDGTITQSILPWIREQRTRATCSAVSRETNQYRLFFNNKYAIYITIRAGKPAEIMPMLFKHKVACVCSAELADGSEATYFGSDNGFVYQLDKGSSFDGESIECRLAFAFNHSKSVRVLKRYRKAILELTGSAYAEFTATYQLGYSDPKTAQPGVTDIRAAGLSAPRWDAFVWDAFFWDGQEILPAELSMSGTAENFALIVAGDSADFYPFTLASVMCHYSPRRRLR